MVFTTGDQHDLTMRRYLPPQGPSWVPSSGVTLTLRYPLRIITVLLFCVAIWDGAVMQP